MLVDYQRDNNAISLPDQQTTVQGGPITHKTTSGWQMCCQWKDSSTSCKNQSESKESHPVQKAEFAVAQRIDHEPAFNWWLKLVLKKRDRIMTSVRKRQTRNLKRSHKFGIELPNTVEETPALNTPMYCVMLMTFYASITMQTLC